MGIWCFQKELEEREGDNHLMRTVFQLYLGYLRSPQSEVLQRHVFGAWRAFIKKVSGQVKSGHLTFH